MTDDRIASRTTREGLGREVSARDEPDGVGNEGVRCRLWLSACPRATAVTIGHGVGPPGLRQLKSSLTDMVRPRIQHFSAFSTGYTMRVAAAEDFSAVARIFSAVTSS